MGILDKLLGLTSKGGLFARKGGASNDPGAPFESLRRKSVPLDTPGGTREDAGAVNIWDLDGTSDGAGGTALEAAGERKGSAPARKRRTKTRLLGFESSDGQVVDMFNNPVAAPSADTRFPVGWVIVLEGPGRGHSFTLQSGMSQIGRGEDQTVQLDFGDTAISRANHAAVVYDPEERKFFLGHGGKSNIVRLNGKAVISNEPLADGDKIRMGETTLQFVALCGADFNWDEDKGSEADNVEIA